MSAHDNVESALLGYCAPSWTPTYRRIAAAMAALVVVGLLLVIFDEFGGDRVKLRLEGRREWWGSTDGPEVVESEVGVVAADDGRCSEIGVGVLKAGGHAVHAAVATTLCLRVVHLVSSGLGEGAFMIVRSSDFGKAKFFDSRETAPSAA